MFKRKTFLSVIFFLAAFHGGFSSFINIELDTRAFGEERSLEVFLDAVIASVNGEPITLHEVLDRLPGHPELSLKEASDNSQVRQVLNGLIMEKLIKEEAEEKKIQASNPEIEGYIDEVASRNQLTREAFEKALLEQGQTIDKYKQQVEIEILKTKLASSMLKGGIAVSDKEIDSYIADHPELTGGGAKVKLRQILISLDNRSQNDAKKILNVLKTKLESGEPFAQLARTYSESPESVEGGSLGVMPEEDLSSTILDAIQNLQPGDISNPVLTPAGIHVFFVEERFSPLGENGDEESIRTEVRRILENQKLEAKMQTYFTQDIYAQHAVENKL